MSDIDTIKKEFKEKGHTPKVWEFFFSPKDGETKSGFEIQVSKINTAVTSIDPTKLTAEAFSSQQEHSIDDVYTSGVDLARVGQEIQARCLAAAKQLNHHLSTDSAE